MLDGDVRMLQVLTAPLASLPLSRSWGCLGTSAEGLLLQFSFSWHQQLELIPINSGLLSDAPCSTPCPLLMLLAIFWGLFCFVLIPNVLELKEPMLASFWVDDLNELWQTMVWLCSSRLMDACLELLWIYSSTIWKVLFETLADVY